VIVVTRYVIVGAGAVGSALGGMLAHRGRDVLLVARGAHGRAVLDRGVHIRSASEDFTVRVPAVDGPAGVRLTVDDVLVLTTKSHQAAAALDQWADVPVHGRDGAALGRAGDLLPLFTALNGVVGEEIALRWFDRVFAVCVWSPAVMIEPGEVIVRADPLHGIFHIGRFGTAADPAADTALVEALGRDFGPAGYRVNPTGDVMRWKYRKLLTNLENALQALLGDTSGADDLRRAAETEAREVLAAAGIAVPDDAETAAAWSDLVFAPVPGQPAQLGGSSWQSLVRGTGTIETDYLNGEIAKIARRLGRSAPINSGLTALARRAARAGLRPGTLTLPDLRAHLTTRSN
jgi:2-dehydropantoate 2-reductase